MVKWRERTRPRAAPTCTSSCVQEGKRAAAVTTPSPLPVCLGEGRAGWGVGLKGDLTLHTAFTV